MSRCFPFPPPGYEKKLHAENLELLTKEKRKEKKHKKEKKEKKDKEHKEKKEKKDKEKRKEKKERKEKHKDRKKDKEVDKGRASEDARAEDRQGGHNTFLHFQESLQKAEQIKDSKFTEELGRRTRDDGVANPMVGTIPSSVYRKNERMGAAYASLSEKDRVAEKKSFPIHISSAPRSDGSSLSIENATNSPQRRTTNINAATSTDHERTKLLERFAVGISPERTRNHGISRPIESISGFANRKAEYSLSGMEKERISGKNASSNAIMLPSDRGKLGAKIAASSSPSMQRRNDVLGFNTENFSSFSRKSEATSNSFVQSRMDGMGAFPAMDKERVKGNNAMFPNLFSNPNTSEQGRNAIISQQVEKDRFQKIDKIEEGRKGLGDNYHIAKKSKSIDTDKSIKAEEAKIIEKAGRINNDNTRNFASKDQINTLNSKPLAPHKNYFAGIRAVDEMTKKRADFRINGFLQENDARPNKMPRTTPSPPPFSLHSKDIGPMNNSKLPKRSLDDKTKNINGAGRLPAAGNFSENGEVSSKPPHPDSKYLHQIYTVPKMDPWLEFDDDQDWLFNGRDSQQKPKARSDNKCLPPAQVWAEAMRIDSADVVALPYVVPF